MAAAFPNTSDDNDPSGWKHKLEVAISYKQAGNDKHKAGEIKAAIGKYHRALLYLRGIVKSQDKLPFIPEQSLQEVPPDVLKEVAVLSSMCYNNLSACLLTSEDPAYEKVVQYCDSVLEESPLNVKALYRKGLALYHLGDSETAVKCLNQAAKQPAGQKDANIRKYLKLCKEQIIERDNEMKNTYKAMFSS